MPTHLEYALMAHDAYNPPDKANPITNWERLKDFTYQPANQWGLGIAVYRNWCRTEYVIAYRGTYLSDLPTAFANLMSDLKLLYEIPPGTGLSVKKTLTQQNAEKAAQEKLKSLISESLETMNTLLKRLGLVSVSYTGHSLGAVIAEINACKTNRIAVTFESPGCGHLLTQEERIIGKKNVISYIHGENMINTAFKHVGITRKISYNPFFWSKINFGFYLQAATGIITLYKQHQMEGVSKRFVDGTVDFIEYKEWPLKEPIAFEMLIKVINFAAQKLGVLASDQDPDKGISAILDQAVDKKIKAKL